MKFGKLVTGVALLFPLAGHAAPIGSVLQAEANTGDALAASVDGTVVGNTEPVTISVLITKSNGLPADNFGDGDDLADELLVKTGFNQPDLGTGCDLTADNYIDQENGVYTFELAPTGTGCVWVIGEYNYAVRINSVIPKVGRYKGNALGSFCIEPALVP